MKDNNKEKLNKKDKDRSKRNFNNKENRLKDKNKDSLRNNNKLQFKIILTQNKMILPFAKDVVFFESAVQF